MVTFPKELKPVFVDNKDLVRLGSIDDGGYVVPIKTIMNSKTLLSFGISDNWDFEKDFVKKSKINVFAYDHSIDNNFWLSKFKRDLIKFLKLKIFKPKKLYKMFQYLDFIYFFKYNKLNKFYLKKIGNDSQSINLQTIINDHLIHKENIFLKIDIENFEYEILDEIISNKFKIQGIVIEFHEVSSNLDKIKEFIRMLLPNLNLVHIHANNYSVKKLDSFPEAIELTFSKDINSSRNNDKEYPIKNLDFPNSKRSPDIKISFSE